MSLADWGGGVPACSRQQLGDGVVGDIWMRFYFFLMNCQTTLVWRPYLILLTSFMYV